MKKTLSILLASSLLFIGATPATAEQQHTIAIIDSGFNTAELGENVVTEVCVLALTIGCNNRSGLDEGPGASGTTQNILPKYNSMWAHGTDMAKAILQENPNAKLVLVRTAKVLGRTVIAANENDFVASLSWVYDNADKYNISAVSFSMGDHKYVSKNRDLLRARAMVKVYSSMVDRLSARGKDVSRYLDKLNTYIDQEASISIPCAASSSVDSAIVALRDSKNVGVFVATGNDSDKRFVDSPACLDSAIAVTAFNDSGEVLDIANVSSNTDFGAVAPNTSTATAKLAARWSLVYNGSYTDTYNSISNSEAHP